jgi:hypothetical protein
MDQSSNGCIITNGQREDDKTTGVNKLSMVCSRSFNLLTRDCSHLLLKAGHPAILLHARARCHNPALERKALLANRDHHRKSTLNPPPPWYYSADFLNIEFWADPSAVTATLPAGLDPDPQADGHANGLFYDWQFSGSNEEYLDPARYQYREFLILVDALFEERPVSYCPYIFVDNDAALARGWTQGYPKRIGSIFQTRYYAATGKAGPALAAGSKFAGSMSAGGRRLAEGVVTLRAPVKDLSVLHQRPVVNLLHFPRLAAGMHGKPVIHELVENVPHDVKVEQAWIGDGALTLPVSKDEELSDLAPRRCGKGLRASMAYVVDDLKTLKALR